MLHACLQAVQDMLAELEADEDVPGSYLRAVLAELFAAAHSNSVPVPPAAHVLDLKLAVQLSLGSQVAIISRLDLSLCISSVKLGIVMADPMRAQATPNRSSYPCA